MHIQRIKNSIFIIIAKQVIIKYCVKYKKNNLTNYQLLGAVSVSSSLHAVSC
jgi:hypothetical protein